MVIKTLFAGKRAFRISLLAGIVLAGIVAGWLFLAGAREEYIWVEGEKPVEASVFRHPWWYDQVQRDEFSGGDFLSHFSDARPGLAKYRFHAPRLGVYEFWVRANPYQTRLSYQLNGGDWTLIDLERHPVGTLNIAANKAADMRFLAWVKVGSVTLRQGENAIDFKMDSEKYNHGMLDCFVFSRKPFYPRGLLKPDEVAKADKEGLAGEKGWFVFDPDPQPQGASATDLRFLNEPEAGAGGFIGVKDAHFIHTKSGAPVRFWGVNGPASKTYDALRREARLLARYGINLVRVYHSYYNDKGDFDPAAVQLSLDTVEAMKAEGVYSYFSIYWPLSLRPAPGTPWLEGYDGKKPPVAALYFNKSFQKRYREWWTALLLTRSERTGKRLIDEPAVAGIEIVNEDNYFWWSFNNDAVPDAELRLAEEQFASWLTKKYGTLEAAFQAWDGMKVARDRPEEGRVGFRPLWHMAHERKPRDKDTAHFFVESQRTFYQETYQLLRDLGFQGVITTSNWHTADPRVLGPLDKYSYTVGDFFDRHGYINCLSPGQADGWRIREGLTYADRSALRFDPEPPSKYRLFVHPAMDVHYNHKPSMLSEVAWPRPNRYRSEAPLFLAAYGALQDSDAIVHFNFDGAHWSVNPGFFMQPWTVMSPATMGQFPAAALLYRQGLVTTGDLLADLNLKIDDLLDLQGTPLPQGAAISEPSLKDVSQGPALEPGRVIDPLVHFAGRTNVNFTREGGPAKLANLTKYIDHKGRVVRSSTGELTLDYGKGVLTLNAAGVQGVSGHLREAGPTELKDLAIASNLEIGHIVAISLDGQPLASSRKILLQVMSEEKASGFRTEPGDNGVQRITNIGHDPWLVRDLEGTVRLKRPDAAALRVTPLDHNGYPAEPVGTAKALKLASRTVYYLITP